MTIQTVFNSTTSQQSILIDDGYETYEIFEDGTIYNNGEATNIPLWVLEFRDFALQHAVQFFPLK